MKFYPLHLNIMKYKFLYTSSYIYLKKKKYPVHNKKFQIHFHARARGEWWDLLEALAMGYLVHVCAIGWREYSPFLLSLFSLILKFSYFSIEIIFKILKGNHQLIYHLWSWRETTSTYLGLGKFSIKITKFPPYNKIPFGGVM